MSSRQTRLRELLLLTGLCGFFFFFRLSAIGLLGPDEPRYAQIAREMLARHDWVTPILYHHTWLEKPILLYWGEMLSYSAFGVADWAARVPSALAATLLVFGTFLAVRRIHYAARLDAALMIASSVLILGFARAAATDMLLASPWCLSLLAWFAWYQENCRVAHVCPPLANVGEQTAPSEPESNRDFDPKLHPERGEGPQHSSNLPGHCRLPGKRSILSARLYLVLFYALNALATLAKGPVAPALAAFVLIAFCASQRNLRALVRTLDPLGLAVFFAVAAPWFVLVQLRTPEFFRVFFLQNNLARFSSNLYRHKQPFWYYLPVALAGTLPWTVWIFHGLSDAIQAILGGPYLPSSGKCGSPTPPDVTPDAPAFTFEIFLFLWALVPIVFFSLSRSKLPGYILPAVPALLILAAVAVHRRAARNQRPPWTSIGAHATLLAALAAAGCVAPRLVFRQPLSPASLLLAAFAGTAIFLLVALPLLTSGWRFLHFVTLLPVILAVGFIQRGFAPALDATQSARPIAELIQQVEHKPVETKQVEPQQSGQPGELPLATFALNRSTAFGLSFYLNRRVDPYEGLEISPAVYELPPAIPAGAHLLITRDFTRGASLATLRLLLAGRSLQLLTTYPPQHIEIFLVSPAESPADVPAVSPAP